MLDLGTVPAADHFPLSSQPVSDSESSHGATMELCRRCGLAQLGTDDTRTQEPRGIEPQALIDQAKAALADADSAGWLTGRTVAEFGSPHGGTWLPNLTARGFADVATGHRGGADVVIDSFGIMHEPDQAAAFAERAASTAEGGVLLLQYHSLAAIVSLGQWNALRHGHFAYYSAPPLVELLTGAGMYPATAWSYDLYGGTVMIAAVHGSGPGDARVTDLLAREDRYTSSDVVGSLQREADRHASGLRAWLNRERAAGRRIYAYGAASRAVAVLSLAGIDSTLLAGVADASPEKVGHRMPGCDVPIIAPSELIEARPDRVLLMVPDLLPEVSKRYPELDGTWRIDSATAYYGAEGGPDGE